MSNNSQNESEFWCKLQQSGTAGFWMSCVAAVAPAVDCVKRPRSREGGGANFKTNFPLFSKHWRAPVSFTSCSIFAAHPPFLPLFPWCEILWGRSSRWSFERAGTSLHAKHTKPIKSLPLKSTRAATHTKCARRRTRSPFCFVLLLFFWMTRIRILNPDSGSLPPFTPPPWQVCVNICWRPLSIWHTHIPTRLCLTPTHTYIGDPHNIQIKWKLQGPFLHPRVNEYQWETDITDCAL